MRRYPQCQPPPAYPPHPSVHVPYQPYPEYPPYPPYQPPSNHAGTINNNNNIHSTNNHANHNGRQNNIDNNHGMLRTTSNQATSVNVCSNVKVSVEVRQFMESIKFENYISKFEEHGFIEMDSLYHMDMEDLLIITNNKRGFAKSILRKIQHKLPTNNNRERENEKERERLREMERERDRDRKYRNCDGKNRDFRERHCRDRNYRDRNGRDKNYSDRYYTDRKHRNNHKRRRNKDYKRNTCEKHEAHQIKPKQKQFNLYYNLKGTARFIEYWKDKQTEPPFSETVVIVDGWGMGMEDIFKALGCEALIPTNHGKLDRNEISTQNIVVLMDECGAEDAVVYYTECMPAIEWTKVKILPLRLAMHYMEKWNGKKLKIRHRHWYKWKESQLKKLKE